MHEINKCVHMDFNKSYGCTCSTDKENMNKVKDIKSGVPIDRADDEHV